MSFVLSGEAPTTAATLLFLCVDNFCTQIEVEVVSSGEAPTPAGTLLFLCVDNFRTQIEVEVVCRVGEHQHCWHIDVRNFTHI